MRTVVHALHPIDKHRFGAVDVVGRKWMMGSLSVLSLRFLYLSPRRPASVFRPTSAQAQLQLPWPAVVALSYVAMPPSITALRHGAGGVGLVGRWRPPMETKGERLG